MKSFIIALLCLNISCTTTKLTSDSRTEISALTGSSIEFVRDKWGKADEEITKGKKKTFKFEKVRFINTDIINRQKETEDCTVWIEADEKGTITSWDKTDCKKQLK